MNTSPFSTRRVRSTAVSDRLASERDRRPLDATARRRATVGERALVIGGGGSTGHAWAIGVVAGLLDAGLDVTEADLIIGTSAGSTAAAQITGAAPAHLLADILAAAPPRRANPAGPERNSAGPVSDQLRRTTEIIAAAQDPVDMRRKLGAAALELDAASD